MIQELHIDDPDRSAVEWWSRVEALKDRKIFTFSPGLTILWGPNGCGKSTILRALARLTHCEQGGTPLVTEESLRVLRDGFISEAVMRDGVRIVGDGKPVHFFDPADDPGLIGGTFDSDFIEQGIQNMFLKRTSSGQQNTAKFNRILKSATELTETPWKMQRERVNKEWQRILDLGTVALRPSPDAVDGPPTLLLDEPDRSVSIPRQAELWDALARQQRFQIIASSHSPFALSLGNHVQYIDLQKNYLAECLAHFRVLGLRIEGHLAKAGGAYP